MTLRMATLLGLIVLAHAPALAQREFGGRGRRFFGGDPNEFYVPPDWAKNTPYDGRFTFARIKYRGYEKYNGREGPGWSHDYPRAESHFMRIIREITTIRPFVEAEGTPGGNIVALDDPELFKYPVGYFSEPGGWYPNEQEMAGMRNYLRKGGFIIFDDFVGNHWYNLEEQMRRVFPQGRWLELDKKHPIFNSFFEITNFSMSYYGIQEIYYGMFEDNDPSKRLLAVAGLNQDLGEYWEFSDQGIVPIDLSNEAYKYGVNYFVYGLTH